jgi:hypothetical protein
VSGTASDDVALATVEVRIDSGNWFTATGRENWSLALATGNLLNGSHTISARATDTAGNVSGIVSCSVRFVNAPGNFALRISPGNPLDVTNCDSTVWAADQPYALGSYGFVGGTPAIVDANAVTGICSAGQMLYRRARQSQDSSAPFTYQFDCPEGRYEIMLLNSETYTNAVSARRFNVFIQGQQVLTNFDLFAASGNQQDVPVTRVFTHTLTSTLVIQFAPVSYLARAAGIQLVKIADTDSDSDGIPDWWMRAYFNHPTGQVGDRSMPGDDPDGDGMSNLQEFLAGTDPTDAGSTLRITSIGVAGNDIAVTWLTFPNKTNQLENSSVPGTNASWSSVGSVTIGTGDFVTRTDPGAATNSATKFYRVRLVP